MENCWEQASHSSQDLYPHYNLFQSSIFYDTDNFRVPCLLEDCLPSESSENEEKSAEPPDKPPEAPPVKPKRVITKHELYKDPEMFGKDDGQSSSNRPIDPCLQPWGYDWTKQSWVKAGAPMEEAKEESDSRETCQNMAPRVNNIKAESMMQKMGWQGGALGKAGDGIVEPIAPNHARAFRPSASPGARCSQKPARSAPGKRSQAARRDAFRTNVLMHILEFVQDDTETELLFDTGLRQHERRHITNIVNSVINDAALHALGSTAQYELARDIHTHNRYLLECAQGDEHQLGIYKEAPEDVYLVTPDDFSTKDENDPADSNDADDNDAADTNGAADNDAGDENDVKTNGELDDDENPFLKSIKKSIKKDDEPKLTNKFETDCVIAKESEVKDEGGKGDSPVPPADKMMEFFLEFAEAKSYKEMRFLGTFTDEQSSAINAVLNDVSSCPLAGFQGEELIANALRSGSFRVKAGVNGTPEIHKVLDSKGKVRGNT